MQVKKQQLELDMEQQTGSKLGKEYVKAVYCHPARILLKYTINIDEENKVGGKLTVWFRSLLSLLGEPT